ncbi:MAG: hypothetical protein WCT49_00695 [Candidatus Paceibacterota bacterium]|jgi:hypothetical protein|nr:hypothetical protein [Candidatus Paceibacterota bacterium]
MDEPTNIVIPQKVPEKPVKKLPEGSGSLPTKANQDTLDKVFDMMKNPKHYNIKVKSEDDNKKLSFVTGLKLIEGTFLTETAVMTMRVSGVNISLNVGGALADTWSIEGVKTYVEKGYDTAYDFADWLWKNKK